MPNSRKPAWILTRVALYLLLVPAAFAAAFQFCEYSAATRGWLGAKWDISQGHYRILSYGLPGSNYPTWERLMREKYQIDVRRVAGCVVATSLVLYVDAYNEVSQAALLAKHGQQIVQDGWATRIAQSSPFLEETQTRSIKTPQIPPQ